MEKDILNELKGLKALLAQLIGTAESPAKERFSKEAIAKAAKEFQKLSIERGEWVEDGSINKYIKSAPYRCGAFIRQEFGFTNCFKRGQTYYFNRKDLIELNKALKARNIDLKRYMEYREDQEKFRRYVNSVLEPQKGKRKKKFDLPYDLQDIVTSAPTAPSADVIREDLKALKEEFITYKLSEYIDIYRDSHAMMKFVYYFEKYLNPELKRRCKRWIDNFNYANEALKLVTGKKERFVPIREDDMIQL